jgi:hypothetical protein
MVWHKHDLKLERKCKLNDINPEVDLRVRLTRIADGQPISWIVELPPCREREAS